MDAPKRRQINDLADRIREALEISAFPVDVELAVERLGGVIEELPDDSEGEAMIRKSADGFVIGLAPRAHVRRRFSIAHELGHLFVHMGYLIDPEKWAAVDEYRDSPRYRFGYTEAEYEAHEFAGAFLMPKSEFVRIAGQHRTGDTFHLEPIAEHFGVSTAAVKTRGRWLDLFAWQ